MSLGRRFLVIAALQSGCKDIAAALCRGMPLAECRSVTALDELNRALDEAGAALAAAVAFMSGYPGGISIDVNPAAGFLEETVHGRSPHAGGAGSPHVRRRQPAYVRPFSILR